MKNITIILVLGVVGTLVLSFLLPKKEPKIEPKIGAGEEIIVPSKAEIDAKVEAVSADVEAEQLLKVQQTGKYEHVPLTTDVSGVKYTVTEYKTPSGEVGYQTIFYNEDGSVESKGYGPEAASRTYSIAAPIIDTTPSSTPK